MARLMLLLTLPSLVAGQVHAQEAKLPPPTEKQFKASADNLRKIGLGMARFADAHKDQLPNNAYARNGQALLSWRVAILPIIEHEKLYEEFHLDEPWDSPHNVTLLPRMPSEFASQGDVVAEPFTTPFQAVVGPGAAFERNRGARLTDFTDGTEWTIMLAEASQTVPWTQPADLVYDPNGPLPPLGRVRGNRNLWLFRRSAPALLVAMADGAVRTVSKQVPEATLRAAITRNGGEVMPEDWWAAPKAGR